MDFPGIGVIPVDSPPKNLEQFIRRKHLAHARSFEANKNGTMFRSFLQKDLEHMAQQLPAEVREKVLQERTDLWNWVVMAGKTSDTITEKEFVDVWTDRVFAKPEEKMRHLQRAKDIGQMFFEHLDLNKDGVIDYSEWEKGCSKVLDEKSRKTVFDTIDKNHDHLLQQEEWLYAILYFCFISGPDSPLSILFGPVPDEQI